ncbi:host cell division inhibitor Icd-like protein [Serratia liquefaciens]|uniref:host cell division inhibitor Icd-like protein n=1 Tax=Serratia liquefaciens TaxID=614 RepID=UPI0039C5B17D
MADIKSTQTRLEFTWRFLATTGARITVVYTNACTESEARANCPGWKLIFAARFPLHQFEVVRHA